MNKLTDKELRILEKDEICCGDVTATLGSYVDNELTPSLRERIRGHIRACPECEKGEHQYREVIRLAKELPEHPVDDEMKKRLRLALNARLGISLPL